jgi:hypothetical protein
VRDGDDEAAVGDLAGQAEAEGCVELVGAVHGERVGRAAHGTRDLRDGGGVGAEVDVQVLDAALGHLVEQQQGLGEVGEVMDHAAMAVAGEVQGLGEPAQGRGGMRDTALQERARPAALGLRREAERLLVLLDVVGIDDAVRRAADGEARDLAELTLDLLQLPPDERVAHGRVHAGEISNLHCGYSNTTGRSEPPRRQGCQESLLASWRLNSPALSRRGCAPCPR